jgi:hypothetical protein
MRLFLYPLLACLVMLGGCDSFERDTFNTLAASQAVINQAQADYTAKTIPENACTYAVINAAKGTQIAAVNAMVIYEQEKAAKTSLTAQTAVVVADIAALPAIILQVKTLYTNPTGCTTPAATGGGH